MFAHCFSFTDLLFRLHIEYVAGLRIYVHRAPPTPNSGLGEEGYPPVLLKVHKGRDRELSSSASERLLAGRGRESTSRMAAIGSTPVTSLPEPPTPTRSCCPSRLISQMTRLTIGPALVDFDGGLARYRAMTLQVDSE